VVGYFMAKAIAIDRYISGPVRLIKFGEPNFDIGLGVRRAIQPQPGRLVLFPSYMWQGTIPFQGSSKRTTIAFDAVPD
jgi:hypothetical protein